MFDHLTLTLAQEDAAPAPSAPIEGAPAGGDTSTGSEGKPVPPGAPSLFGPPFLFIMLAVFVLMMIFSSRSQGKDKKRREQMIAALKKGQRVTTIGGMIGSVVEVRDDQVILKVDENANTRIRFTRSAVQGVIEDEKDDG